MEIKFKVIIDEGESQQVIDCEHLDKAIVAYREALNTHSQNQITLARVIQ